MLLSQCGDTCSRELISIICHYSIIAHYECLPSHMEPLEDRNERSIILWKAKRYPRETMHYGRLLRSPRGGEDRTKVCYETD